MDNKPCANCGTLIPNSSAFCPTCGHPQQAPEGSPGGEGPTTPLGDLLACQQCGTPHTQPYPTHCRLCGRPLDLPASGSAYPPQQAASQGSATQPGPIPHPDDPPTGPLSPDTGPVKLPGKRNGPSRLKFPARAAIITALAIVIIFILGWFLGNRGQQGDDVSNCTPFEIGKDFEVSNQNDLKGSLYQDSYMEAGRDYAIADGEIFTIASGTTLIIEPGARIKFGKGSKMVVRGELLACGTRSRRILFTADATTGSPGYWQGIELINTSTEAIIGHANFEFGGSNDHAVIWVDHSDLVLEDVRFESNKFLSLSLSPDRFPAVISPVSVDSGPEGWELRAGKLAEDLEWGGQQPLIINGELEIPAEMTLTIQAGSHLKFLQDSSLSVYGKIVANGTPQKHIRVTSASDILGEQSNRLAGQAWTGFFFIGEDAKGEFSYVDFQYQDGEEK